MVPSPEIITVVDFDSLAEPCQAELGRIRELHGRHLRAHRDEGVTALCGTCELLRKQAETLAGGELTPMAIAVEQVAMKLARQAWGASEADRTATLRIWDKELTQAGRGMYRRRAVDMLTMLDGVLGLTLPVDPRIV